MGILETLIEDLRDQEADNGMRVVLPPHQTLRIKLSLERHYLIYILEYAFRHRCEIDREGFGEWKRDLREECLYGGEVRGLLISRALGHGKETREIKERIVVLLFP